MPDILGIYGTGEVIRITTWENQGYLTYFVTVRARIPGFKPGSHFDQYLTLVGNTYHCGKLAAGNLVQFTGAPQMKAIKVRSDGSYPTYGELNVNVHMVRVIESSAGEETYHQKAGHQREEEAGDCTIPF